MPAIVEIGFNASQVYSGLSKLETRLGGFASRMDKTLASIGGNLSLASAFNVPAMARFGGDLVSAAAKMEGYRAAITAVSKDTVPLESQLNRLRELAKSPGLSFDEAIKGSIRLQATGLSAAQSEKTLKEMANALRAVGGSADQLDGITLALTQIQAKGKVSAEEINQIAERMPQIRAVMKAAFGTADSEALQKMGLSSERFIIGITNELAKAPRVMNGANSAIEQLVDNFNQLKAAAGEPLAQAIVPVIKDMTQAAIQSAPEIKKMMEGFVNAGPVVLGVAKAFVSYYGALKAIQLATFVTGLIAKRQAIAAAAAATQTETVAVQANTAALQANAAAATTATTVRAGRRGQPAAAAAPAAAPAYTAANHATLMGRPQAFDAAANNAALAAAGQRAATAHANAYMTRLGSGISSMGPMIGTAAASMYASSLMPATADAAEQAKAMLQSTILTGLSALGGPIGAAAMGWQIGQTIKDHYARKELDAAKDSGAQIDRTSEASKESATMLKNGNLAQARKILENEIATLVNERASSEGDAAMHVGISLNLMQRELATLTTRNAVLKEAAVHAQAKTNAELRAARVREQAAAQTTAKGKTAELGREMQMQTIRFQPPEKQFEMFGQLLKQKLQAAMADVNSSRFLSGKGQLSGVESSMDGIQRAVDRLKSQGDWINAEKLLTALKAAQPEAEKLAELSAQMRESAANLSAESAEKAKAASLAAHRLEMTKLEAGYEAQILAAKIASGGKDSASVKAAEDMLAAHRLALQIEDAGIATGEAAWNLALKRVETQRQLTNLIERQQQMQARQSVAEDIAILQAKVAGQEELVKQLEREKEIRERTRQLMDSTGATQAQARSVATRMVDLESQASAPSGNSRYDANGMRADGRHKIDARIAPGDRNDHLYSTGEKSGEAKRQNARGRLAEQYAKFQEPLYGEKNQNPLAQKAGQNAAKQDAPSAGGADPQLGQQILLILQQMLPVMQ